jgi:hypothetical protein
MPVKLELQYSNLQLIHALATETAIDIVKYFLIDAKLGKARKLDLQTEKI